MNSIATINSRERSVINYYVFSTDVGDMHGNIAAGTFNFYHYDAQTVATF